MPKYLVTATAYRRAEGSESYSPRTYTFEVKLDAPWSGKNSASLRDVAFHECHRVYGFWPKQSPQIDSVVEVHQPFLDALTKIAELAQGADQMDTWDHIDATDILSMIPDEVYHPVEPTVADWTETADIENRSAPAAENAEDDFDPDSLI